MGIMKYVSLLGACILFLWGNMCYAQKSDSVCVNIMQQDVYIVRDECSQQINFDLNVENKMLETINLKGIELYVYDKSGSIVSIKALRDGPLMPSIGTIPIRKFRSNENVTVFNPFTVFNPYVDLHRLRFILSFKSDSGEKIAVEVDVNPKQYISKSDLSIPLKGTLFISDGNDLYANHRRLDLNNPLVSELLDIQTNSEMFAVDFSVIDSLGREYSKDWGNNRNHYIFGQTVYAPSGGKIVKINDQYDDNKPGTLNFKIQDVKTNKDLLPGNCIVIDHLNGEYSFLVHLKRGSVLVKEGEMVEKGQPVGQVGNSGSSMYPHLHYQMGNSPNYVGSIALPLYFHDYGLISGSEKVRIKKGYLTTGDIVENK